MNQDTDKPKIKTPGKPKREDRIKAALRVNLQRRKQKERTLKNRSEKGLSGDN